MTKTSSTSFFYAKAWCLFFIITFSSFLSSHLYAQPQTRLVEITAYDYNGQFITRKPLSLTNPSIGSVFSFSLDHLVFQAEILDITQNHLLWSIKEKHSTVVLKKGQFISLVLEKNINKASHFVPYHTTSSFLTQSLLADGIDQRKKWKASFHWNVIFQSTVVNNSQIEQFQAPKSFFFKIGHHFLVSPALSLELFLSPHLSNGLVLLNNQEKTFSRQEYLGGISLNLKAIESQHWTISFLTSLALGPSFTTQQNTNESQSFSGITFQFFSLGTTFFLNQESLSPFFEIDMALKKISERSHLGIAYFGDYWSIRFGTGIML